MCVHLHMPRDLFRISGPAVGCFEGGMVCIVGNKLAIDSFMYDKECVIIFFNLMMPLSLFGSRNTTESPKHGLKKSQRHSIS